MNDFKIGDKVFTIELNGTRTWKWESIIIAIESNYIETCYVRDKNNIEILELSKGLSPIHRTFMKQYVKNYFGKDGSINIEKI